MACDLNGVALVDPAHLFTELWDQGLPTEWFHGLANAITVPVERDHGVAKVLMRADHFRYLPYDKTSLTLTFRDDDRGTVAFQKLCLLSDDTNLPFDRTAAHVPLLLTLADRRYRFKQVVSDVRYNCRDSTGAFTADSTIAGVPYSWAGVVSSIWARLRLAFPDLPATAPAFPSAPAGTPEGFEFVGRDCWTALCDAVFAGGALVKYDPVSDTTVLIDPTAAGPAEGVEQDKLVHDTAGKVTFGWPKPETVVVSFPRLGRADRHEEVVTVGGTPTNTAVALRDDGLMAVGDPVSNTTALAAKAAVVADQWVLDQEAAAHPQVAEYQDWIPWCRATAGYWNYTRWAVYDRGVKGDGTGGIFTSVGTGSFLRLPAAGGGGGGGSSAGAWVLVLANVSAAEPVACEEVESDDGWDCWPKYEFAVVQTYSATCGTWTSGTCVFLTAPPDQPRPAVGQRYWAYPAGEPPAAALAAAVPIGIPCTDYTEAPLYMAVAVEDSRTVLVQVAVSPELCAGDFLIYYQGKAQRAVPTGAAGEPCAWEDIEDPVLIAEVNGCPLNVGERYKADFDGPVRDTFTGTTPPSRQCTSLYTVRDKPLREGVSSLTCVGGVLRVYEWVEDALNPCTYTEEYAYSAGCCDCDGDEEGGGGGGGGTGDCCSRVLNATLYASVPGEGTMAMVYDGAQYWVGGALLSCGESLYLRFNKTGCAVDFSCDKVNWRPATAGIGARSCGPPFTSEPWNVNMDDTLAGCVAGLCVGLINGIVIRE